MKTLFILLFVATSVVANPLIFLSGSPPAVTAAPAHVQTAPTSSGSGAASRVITFSSPTVSGRLIVVNYHNWQSGTSVTGVTDNKGNTYANAWASTNGSSRNEQWYAYNITGGASHVVTVAMSGNADSVASASEYSGIRTASDPKGVTQTGSGASGNLFSGDTAVPATNSLFVASGGNTANTTITLGTAGPTERVNAGNSAVFGCFSVADKVSSGFEGVGWVVGNTGQPWSAGIGSYLVP